MIFLENNKYVIVQDRHGGAFSGGHCLALRDPFGLPLNKERVENLLREGPSQDYGGAMHFWIEPPSWINSGDTIEQALDNLKHQVPVKTWISHHV